LSCARNSKTEKYQNRRDNIVNVHEKVKEIETGDIYIGSVSRLYIINDYLLIRDPKSFDKQIRIFDKNSFNYVTSVGNRGQGPGEITNMGHIASNEVEGKFYVNDHGKLNIFSYDIDSAIADVAYMPTIKLKLNNKIFPDKYQYFNDTLCVGRVIEFTGNSFDQSVGKWNMITGEIIPMKYTHPGIERKETMFAASIEYGIYVETYTRYDLMTICTLDGDLKYNIYGPRWNKSSPARDHHYGNPAFYRDKIIVSYSGGDWRKDEYFPTKFIVFDLNGNYLKTLDVGYKIQDFCIDNDNSRIIMSLDDMIQFAYLDLDGLI
jgi:hypothetical protein